MASEPAPPTPIRPAAVPLDGAVFEASFGPSPASRPLAFCGALAALAAAGVGLLFLIETGLGMRARGLATLGELAQGLACSAVPILLLSVHLWEFRLELARSWFRVTPERLEWECVWWGVRRFGTVEILPGDGLLDEPGPWFGEETKAAVSAIVGGKTTPLTRRLSGEDGARVRAGVAGVLGMLPAGRPVGPWLAPADPQAPPYPLVRVHHDRRGRPAVIMPLNARRGWGRWVFVALGVALASAIPTFWWERRSEWEPAALGSSLGWSVWAAAGLITGAAIAAAPWATRQVAFRRARSVGPRWLRGEDRLLVRTGWGRLRFGRSVRASAVRDVATALHLPAPWGLPEAHTKISGLEAFRYRRNPGAVLVHPARWAPAGRTERALTGRAPQDRPEAFAAAAAGAVKAMLIAEGWQPQPRQDWRFGVFEDDPAAP
ncbi:hypothetical protein [Alienimonas sp. DA493]|uniref:hypothetical protein n=1 Tax=Alienimonas sp. DA493 TaxID=3373605 RepID=UPI003754DD5C